MKKSLKNIYSKNKDVLFDIFIFGSAVKGKEFAGDVDIAVVFRYKVEDKLLKEIENLGKNLHVTYLRLDELTTQALWITLLKEGFSVSKNRYLSEIVGLESYGLFTYDLKGIKNKARFSQVLMGYKSESILKIVHGQILKPGVALVPHEYVEYFRTFLQTWKVRYSLKQIMV